MKSKVLSLFDIFYKEIDNSYYTRAFAAVYLFDYLDRLRINNFPSDWFNIFEKEMKQIRNMHGFMKASLDLSLNKFDSFNDEKPDDVEARTGEMYYNLWKNFTKEEYFKQTAEYLKERFEKNGISVDGVGRALDDGCGSGRYTLSLKALGCKNVTGIDVSPDSVALATKMNSFPEQKVKFMQGSVLELPFENDAFDFVFSNGVLHHTLSTEKGLAEIYRVLKKGGRCWLYLYGGKDSLFWDIVDFCRKLLENVPQNYTQTFMRVLGYPAGRIFHRTDFFYVPINRRYYTAEVEQMIKDSGFSKFERLKRGIAHDWDEVIYANPHIDPYIYGEGEMRYLMRK